MPDVYRFISYVVYDHPSDYPDSFVVRKWEDDKPDKLMGTAPTLEAARKLIPKGYAQISRFEQDDPVIVEIWI